MKDLPKVSASTLDAGFRPGSRGPFLLGKGPKTGDAPSGLTRLGRRGKREGGPTRYAHTKPANVWRAPAHKVERQASVRRKGDKEICEGFFRSGLARIQSSFSVTQLYYNVKFLCRIAKLDPKHRDPGLCVQPFVIWFVHSRSA